jgi:hypothetical protein
MLSYFPATPIRQKMPAAPRKRWQRLIAVHLLKKPPGVVADDVRYPQGFGPLYGEFLSFRDG